ncbi:MAG: GntR family transcriptional regulator [Bauldia sp.]|nr:GntR family transcriptional regulator [Bauldia sp.]
MSAKRPTLAEQAYEELQDQIVSGRLPAGRRLLADQLADSLAISQTPVKEALARLEQVGLVEGTSRRASVVRRFTFQDIEEIYEARLLLEVQAIGKGLAAGRATPEFLDRLQAVFDEQMRELSLQTEQGLADAIRLDRQFHELLVGLGSNHLIADWHRIALRQTQAIRNYSLASYSIDRVRREHGAIVEAIRAGDADRAVDAIRFHLKASREEFLSRPPEEFPTGP